MASVWAAYADVDRRVADMLGYWQGEARDVSRQSFVVWLEKVTLAKGRERC